MPQTDRTFRGGRRLALPPIPEYLALRPTFEIFLTLKGRARETVDGHADAMRRITSQLATAHPTTDAVDLFVFTLYRSEHSFSHKVNNVKALEYWLEFTGQPRTFGRPKKPRRLIKQPPTEMEINRLFLACRTPKEKAILALLAYGNMRPTELCHVRRQDIDLGANTLLVHQAKGLKERIVELPSGCVTLVMHYPAEHPRAPDDYLFLTYQANRYTTGALRKRIKILGRRAGFNRRLWPYLMRHAYATNLVLRGASQRWIQKQMGHAWSESTLVYFESVATSQFESHERLFPKYE